MKNAISANWVAENGVATATGFTLKGSGKGYASFMKAFNAGDQVFYSAHDDRGNREAGYATFDGSNLINRHATATLNSGVYQHQSPPKVNFIGDITIACTFNAVAFNVLWKALDAIDPDGDGSINIPPELIDGLVAALNSKAEQADLEKEIQDRIDADKSLQDQIDAIDPDGDRKVDWGEIEGKPSEFPPEAHDQGWDTITGKPADYPPSAHNHAWDQITGKPSEFPPADHNHDGEYLKTETDPTVPDHVKAITTDDIDNWNANSGAASTWDELTGKPTEFPPEAHTHDQSEVDGLETRLDAIEDSITSGGGFVDAPDDGKLYGRQSEAWAEVVIPDAADPDWADIQNKPTEFPPEDHDQPWSSITDKPAKFPPADHTHDYLSDAPDDGAQYARQSVNSKMVWSVVSSDSLVHVDDDAPENPATGQLWFDTDNGTLNLFDGNDWINIATGSKTIYTLPVSLRTGVVQLPVSEDADSLPVLLRSGESAIPLNQSGDILAVNTRGGELELPLAA